MSDLNTFLELYGLTAIFLLMLVKSAGVPIPIPADAVLLLTSARAAEGKFDLGQSFILLLTAMVLGGLVQFTLVRGPGRGLLYRYGHRFGLTPCRLDVVAARLQKGGVLGVTVAIVTPGIRSVAVPASGLSGVRFSQFAPGLVAGSALFLLMHFALGLVGGSLLSHMTELAPLPVLVGSAVATLLAGLAVWIVVHQQRFPGATRREIVASAIASWHDAACPACLAIATFDTMETRSRTTLELATARVTVTP